MKRLAGAGCVALLLGPAATATYGQPSSPDRRRIEVSAGIVWQGRASFGSRDANETTGAGGSFRLFTTASELTAASGIAARLTVPLVRRIEVELSGSYSKPDVATHVSADVETSNAPIDAAVHVQQFTVGGAALWYPTTTRLGSRTTLFVRAGGGLERHVEEGGKRVLDAPAIEAGGGLKYLIASRTGGWWRGIGARVDIYALVRGAATALDARSHVSPALGASVYLRF